MKVRLVDLNWAEFDAARAKHPRTKKVKLKSTMDRIEDAKPERDEPTADATKLQQQWQRKATEWWANGDTSSLDSYNARKTMPQQAWEHYQEPGSYELMNNYLRGTPTAGVADAEGQAQCWAMDNHMMTAFKQAGVKTPRPLSLYRGLRGGPGVDWVKTLKPGATFTDKGFQSTTATKEMAQGWLTLKNDKAEMSSKIDPRSVVMEIRVPTGTTVLGGSTGFCETIMPPSTYKVVSVTQRPSTGVNPFSFKSDTATDPNNLANFKLSPGYGQMYTHVVVELQSTDFSVPVPKEKLSPAELMATTGVRSYTAWQ